MCVGYEATERKSKLFRWHSILQQSRLNQSTFALLRRLEHKKQQETKKKKQIFFSQSEKFKMQIGIHWQQHSVINWNTLKDN